MDGSAETAVSDSAVPVAGSDTAQEDNRLEPGILPRAIALAFMPDDLRCRQYLGIVAACRLATERTKGEACRSLCFHEASRLLDQNGLTSGQPEALSLLMRAKMLLVLTRTHASIIAAFGERANLLTNLVPPPIPLG
ncbi:MAG: hypothetical protein AAB592_05930 [Patescibacteria group bacterium]